MTVAELEKRLTAVEQELALLRQERDIKPHPAQLLESIHGTFENDESFREAMQIGQKWRRPQDKKPRRTTKAKRK